MGKYEAYTGTGINWSSVTECGDLVSECRIPNPVLGLSGGRRRGTIVCKGKDLAIGV